MRVPPWLRDGHADQELQGCWYGHPKVGGTGAAPRGHRKQPAATYVRSRWVYGCTRAHTHTKHSDSKYTSYTQHIAHECPHRPCPEPPGIAEMAHAARAAYRRTLARADDAHSTGSPRGARDVRRPTRCCRHGAFGSKQSRHGSLCALTGLTSWWMGQTRNLINK